MSIDWNTGVPFMSPEEPEEERRKRKRIVLVGGAMSGMGGYTGPLYPVLLNPVDDEKEEDPNP